MSSDVLVFEIGRNPHRTRQEFAIETVSAASTYIPLSRMVEGRAEAAEVDFFCTCDDSFLNHAKREVRSRTKVVSPLELAEEIQKWQSQQDH